MVHVDQDLDISRWDGGTYNDVPDLEFLWVHPVVVVWLRLGLLAAQSDVEHLEVMFWCVW